MRRAVSSVKAPGVTIAVAKKATLLVSIVATCVAVTSGVGEAWNLADRDGRATEGAAGIGDPYFPTYGNGGYDVVHYDLAVRYDPSTDVLRGVATIRAYATQDLSRFNLDLVGLTVRDVTVNGQLAFWSRVPHELVVIPGHPLPRRRGFDVVVRYDGVPATLTGGLGVSGFFHTDDGALVAGQPEVAATWFPVNDHPLDKASYTFHVTVSAGLEVVANGLPAGTSSAGGWSTHVWDARSPMASYLATVAIGDFDIRVRRAAHGLPIIDAVDPDVGTVADAALSREPEILSFLERVFGPYPFESAGAIVDDYAVLFALENQTRPVYSPIFFFLGLGETVVVHELAHQWYGDSVGLARWQDIWLNEGFATYAEWLWSEHVGVDSPQQRFDDAYAAIAAHDPFWALPIGDPGPARLFDSPVYDRGAMTLQALRISIGDQAFFSLLRTWARNNAGGTATTADFTALAERVSRRDLGAFFEAWLFSPTKPPPPHLLPFSRPSIRPFTIGSADGRMLRPSAAR
jgi:aminopeptidase N